MTFAMQYYALQCSSTNDHMSEVLMSWRNSELLNHASVGKPKIHRVGRGEGGSSYNQTMAQISEHQLALNDIW